MPDLELKGCTPEPLMAYLKALGVLRLVSEQKDPEARGWWKNDVFWLRSKLDENGLVEFFLKEYEPTPLLAPWNAGSGFFLKWEKEKDAPRNRNVEEMLSKIESSENARYLRYKKQIKAIKEFLREHAERLGPRDILKRAQDEGWSKEKTNKELDEHMFLDDKYSIPKEKKDILIRLIRNELNDVPLRWLDTAFIIGTGRKKNRFEAPLLGSGGNIGNTEFSARFMQLLTACVPLNSQQAPSDESKQMLRSAIFSDQIVQYSLSSAALEPDQDSDSTSKKRRRGKEELSAGQFDPGQAGGANMVQGMEAEPRINPWNYVLMLEGAVMFCGAASKRFGSTASVSAFPFTVEGTPAGCASAGFEERRGEQWLPLWERPCTAGEIAILLAEGRAELGCRTVRTGIDFARAAVSLGVDRGIKQFVRVQYQKRFGDSYLANPVGRINVVTRESVGLLYQIDPWLDSFRKATSGKEAPPRFVSALRQIESAIFDFCKYGGNTFFQRILIALGTAERELALTSGKIGDSEQKVHPLAGLSPEWIKSANDDSQEFTIALALASIWDEKIGPLRTNLEPVNVWFGEGRQQASWAEKERHVVWNSTDLFTNLANTLERRIMDGNRQNSEHLPIGSSYYAPLDAVAAFLAGNPDYSRIEELLWGLILVDTSKKTQDKAATSSQEFILPREYALLKLLFLPRPLVPEHSGNGIKWRLANVPRNGIVIRPEPRILPLLRAGRIGEACRIAAQRLRSSGLIPMPGFLPCGRARDEVWADRPADPKYGLRLAATLLIPICSEAVDKLVKLVCRADESEAAEALMSERGGV